MSEDPFRRFRREPSPTPAEATTEPVADPEPDAATDPFARFRATSSTREATVTQDQSHDDTGDTGSAQTPGDAFARFKAAKATKAAPPVEQGAPTGAAAPTSASAFDRFKASPAAPPPAAPRPVPSATVTPKKRTGAFDQFKPAPNTPNTPGTPNDPAPRAAFDRFKTGAQPTPPAPATTPAATPPTAPPSLPALDLSLDLDAPTSAPAPAPSPAAPSVPSLDLSLDLTPQTAPATASAPTPVGAATTSRHAPLPNTLAGFPGLPADTTTLLGHGCPPVAVLDRVQSAVGTLRFTLDTSDRITLGCVYETTDGTTRVAVTGDTNPTTPILLTPSGQILVNLRQIHQIKRFMVTVRAASPETRWSGVVTATLDADTAARFPIEHPTAHESMVLSTGFVVDGRLALRAENDHVDVPLRALCDRYGYARLAWRDDRTAINPA